MYKYIVISYEKITDFVSSHVFETKKEALTFISENHLIDKLHKEVSSWIYKIVEIDLLGE